MKADSQKISEAIEKLERAAMSWRGKLSGIQEDIKKVKADGLDLPGNPEKLQKLRGEDRETAQILQDFNSALSEKRDALLAAMNKEKVENVKRSIRQAEKAAEYVASELEKNGKRPQRNSFFYHNLWSKPGLKLEKQKKTQLPLDLLVKSHTLKLEFAKKIFGVN